MFVCNLLLFNYQVITVLMNLIKMLISDSYHTKRRGFTWSHSPGLSLVCYPERSGFPGQTVTCWKLMKNFKGICVSVICMPWNWSPDSTLLLQAAWSRTPPPYIHFPIQSLQCPRNVYTLFSNWKDLETKYILLLQDRKFK